METSSFHPDGFLVGYKAHGFNGRAISDLVRRMHAGLGCEPSPWSHVLLDRCHLTHVQCQVVQLVSHFYKINIVFDVFQAKVYSIIDTKVHVTPGLGSERQFYYCLGALPLTSLQLIFISSR